MGEQGRPDPRARARRHRRRRPGPPQHRGGARATSPRRRRTRRARRRPAPPTTRCASRPATVKSGRGHQVALPDPGAAEMEPLHGSARRCPPCRATSRSGRRGQSRNEQFQRFTTRTERPVVRFDLCTKCTLCWLRLPRRVLRPDDGRPVRRELRLLRRLRPLRPGVPGQGVHRHGGRAALRRQQEPVGAVPEGQGRLHRLGRGEEGHAPRDLPLRHGHGR